jgi:hypothetical protein
MNTFIKFTAVALVGVAISGCEQRPDIKNEVTTEQPEYLDGGSGSDAEGYELNDVAPTTDPNSEDRMDDMADEPMTSDESLEQNPSSASDASE